MWKCDPEGRPRAAVHFDRPRDLVGEPIDQLEPKGLGTAQIHIWFHSNTVIADNQGQLPLFCVEQFDVDSAFLLPMVWKGILEVVLDPIVDLY
jgi:hypothetical protein